MNEGNEGIEGVEAQISTKYSMEHCFFGSKIPRIGKMTTVSDEQASFGEALWSDDLRPFFLHFVGDLVKTVSILLSLALFWEIVRFLRVKGYPDEYVGLLEKTHFAFMWIALLVLGGNFVTKVASLWRKKK